MKTVNEKIKYLAKTLMYDDKAAADDEPNDTINYIKAGEVILNYKNKDTEEKIDILLSKDYWDSPYPTAMVFSTPEQLKNNINPSAITINEPLFLLLKDSCDNYNMESEFILFHELGHILNKHHLNTPNGSVSYLSNQPKDMCLNDIEKHYEIIAKCLINKGFDVFEYEADAVAVDYMGILPVIKCRVIEMSRLTNLGVNLEQANRLFELCKNNKINKEKGLTKLSKIELPEVNFTLFNTID